MHCRRGSRAIFHLGAVFIVLGLCAATAPAAAGAEGGSSDGPEQWAVAKTYNDAPFRCRMELTARKAGYRIYRITYPSPVTTPVEANNQIPADYYLPDGIEPGDAGRPAVVCLHILEGNFVLVRMLCSSLAARGVPAVMFKLPYYGERGGAGGRRSMVRDPKLFAEAIGQGIEDARRTLDVMASRPEIDPKRIGIAGISLGGLVSAATAGRDARFARVVLILAGGDLPTIIGHCREARDIRELLGKLPDDDRATVEAAIRNVDPLRSAAGLRDRALAGKVLMVNATEDNVIPPACSKKLAAALGMADKVVWLKGLGHYTAIAALPQTMRQAVDFFAADLPDDAEAPRPGTSDARRPLQIVAGVVTQAASFLTSEPDKGRCHLVDIEASVTETNGKTHEGRIRFLRGRGHRFALEVKAPVIGSAALGQGEFPWIASSKTVFCGVNGPTGPVQDPLALANREYLGKVRMVAGGVAALSLAPGVLEQAVRIEDKTPEGGPPTLLVALKDGRGDQVRLVMDRNGRAPRSATFEVKGVRGTITVRAWQANTVAHDRLFEPPAELARQEVDRADLYRIYSAMFNFAMEMTE